MKLKAQPAQLDLFASSPEPWSVTQVNRYVKSLLDGDYVLQDLWVEGEVSNLRVAASGHAYFTLKDAQASLRCVMWRSDVGRQDLLPQDGQSALAHGRVSVYEVAGTYQFYVDRVQLAGIGRLYLEFEALKRRLAEEGLFDPARKRPLPPFPRRLGVVTSPTAAALRDILNVLARRYPLVDLLLSPAMVQGDQAPPQIVAAIEALNRHADVDVIIVARGGGSLEELWPFNEEIVARAIYASRIPVVSAVGHETDYTIADYVADLRASTPSAAAELVVPDRREISRQLRGSMITLAGWMAGQVAGQRAGVEQLSLRLHRSVPAVDQERERLAVLLRGAHSAISQTLNGHRERLKAYALQLRSLEPRGTLARGYALVQRRADGQVVRSVSQVKGRDRLNVEVADGRFPAEVSRQYGF